MVFCSLYLAGWNVSSDVSEERNYHLARYSLLRNYPDDHHESKTFREKVGGYIKFFLYSFDQQLVALHLHIWTTGGTVANLLPARGNLRVRVQGNLMFVHRCAFSCANTKLFTYKEQTVILLRIIKMDLFISKHKIER